MTKNPFDPIFEEIAKLMKFAYENVDKPVPLEKEEELNRKLDELEKEMMSFKIKNEQLLEDMGVSEYKAEVLASDPAEQKRFSPEHKRILSEAERLKNEATTAAEDIKKAAEESAAAAKEKPMPSPKSTSARSRKGKFRGMGGDEKWKKL